MTGKSLNQTQSQGNQTSCNTNTITTTPNQENQVKKYRAKKPNTTDTKEEKHGSYKLVLIKSITTVTNEAMHGRMRKYTNAIKKGTDREGLKQKKSIG